MDCNDTPINKILGLFLKYGIKSISMDDIAKELGISKKKLYQTFKNKTDIVTKAIDKFKEQLYHIQEEFNNSTLNVIEKEIEHQNRYVDTYLKIKLTFLFDLKKFYPDIYLDFNSFRKRTVFLSVCKYVKDGINQGLFRDNINPKFIASHIVTMSQACFYPDTDIIDKDALSSRQIYIQYFLYHMNGLCSDKGRIILNELIEAKTSNILKDI